ncbi:FlgD immunoglobulin-like domain containing protein [Bacteroidota bacterium]
MKKLYLLFAILILLHITTFSQWSSNPAINNIINNMSGEQAIPKIATCSNGDSYIGFFSNESGNYNVRLQRLNPLGNEMWAANGILISNHTQMSWLTDWDMTADPSGYAILTFQDVRNGGNNNVVAYRIAPDGTFAWGADGLALSNSTAFDVSPKVVATSAGNAVFAWQADDVIILQKVDASGNLLWGANGITLTSTDTYSWPQLLPVGTDEVILKYFHDSGPPNAPTRHVYAQKYDANGAAVWTSPATVSNAGGISAWTQIFSFINDGSDGFYMAWHDDRDNNMDASAFVQHVDNTGTPTYIANGVEVATQSGRERFYPDLALPPGSADVYVVWSETNSDQNQWGISGQKINSSGNLLWPSSGMAFIGLSSVQVSPIGTRSSPTDFVVIYEEHSTVMNSTVKAMRMDANGAFIWSPSMKTMCSIASEKVHSVANNFNNNQWIASWEDNRNGNKDIYAQNIQLDGSLGPYAPQTGFIDGTVSLNGGTGDVTQVEVSAGGVTVNPDASGTYSMEILFGNYDVIAAIPAYYNDTTFGVNVVIGQHTSNIDFTLNPLPTGFISGNVVISSGSGNITDVVITAGSHTTNPDANGDYLIETEIGSHDVIASLTGYSSDTVNNVLVMDGQTITDIDFILDIIPFTGFIEGMVELQNAAGDVTLVDVTADTVTVHPDATGYYIMEVAAGIYDVSATLAGFLPTTQTNISVDTGMITTDVDFFLYQAPNSGYIEGTIIFTSGNADVSQATIYAGSHSASPASDGTYHIYTEAGTYTVIASHPYAQTDSITGVVVVASQTTENVDFTLNVVKADLICKAHDFSGNILNNVDVEIFGPSDTLTGTIVEDSLIFPGMPYGFYEGFAEYQTVDPVYSQADIGENNHYLLFQIDIVSLKEQENDDNNFVVSPNPFSGPVNISFNNSKAGNINLTVYNLNGRTCKTIFSGYKKEGTHTIFWNGKSDSGKDLPKAVYLLVLKTEKMIKSKKIIMR